MDALTLLHVAISLIAILTGLIVQWGLLKGDRMDSMTLVFLVFTGLTNFTGFVFFPITHPTPALILGVISSVMLIVCLLARYVFGMRGWWRAIYVVTAVMALYFNVFVLVVQSFLKVPALHVFAPTGSEPPFAIAQGVVLVAFIVAGVLSAMRFRPAVA